MLTDEEIKRNVAANIRRLLPHWGINQSELARRVNTSAMTISDIVNQKAVPSLAIGARIAEALGLTIDRLIEKPSEKISRRTA